MKVILFHRKYAISEKFWRELVKPMRESEWNGTLGEDKAIAEKLNEFLALVFTTDDVVEFPHTKPFLSEKYEEFTLNDRTRAEF